MNKRRDKRKLKDGHVYHIYNRGNHKDPIMWGNQEPAYYQKVLLEQVHKYNQKLLAYCIMPNHYHLLIKVNGHPKVIPLMMSVFAAYCSRSYNRRHNSVGHLFQDKYKHREIKNPIDLIYTSRYIHRNPLDLQIKPDKYPFSSFRFYKSAKRTNYLALSNLQRLFLDKRAYIQFVESENPYKYIHLINFAQITTDEEASIKGNFPLL